MIVRSVRTADVIVIEVLPLTVMMRGKFYFGVEEEWLKAQESFKFTFQRTCKPCFLSVEIRSKN